MNKKQFISALAQKENITLKESETRLTSVLDLIEEVVASGEDVRLQGHGTYEKKLIKGREGVSHLQGVEKPWKTEDSYKPVFHAGKEFVDRVNG